MAEQCLARVQITLSLAVSAEAYRLSSVESSCNVELLEKQQAAFHDSGTGGEALEDSSRVFSRPHVELVRRQTQKGPLLRAA